MLYGYVRVSSTSQNVDRQLVEVRKFNVPEENIYIDYMSGKNFDRKSYQLLREALKPGDTLVIKSIDRLGRNYKMINDEWAFLTRQACVNIKVIDMPILNTNRSLDDLIGNFISEIVLQILSFVAENERNNIKQRQREGISIAKQKGIHLGRPGFKLPENFESIVDKYEKQEMPLEEALSILGMSRSSFYKYSRLIKEEQLEEKENS